VRLAARRLFSQLTPEGVTREVLRPDPNLQAHELAYLAQKERHPADLNARLAQDLLRFSLPQLLRYEDRLSMAFSVEARTPFLDYRLVELLFSFGSSAKFQNGWSKWILREAMTDLPESIRWRRDKLGFVTPEAEWLQRVLPSLAALFREQPASAEFLDPAKVLSEFQRFDPSRWGARTTEFFRWVALELWLRGLSR
jgi:asparagine synthase (glutamine-hydrolysing)